jgi:two-component system, NtrC family, sensor kinase
MSHSAKNSSFISLFTWLKRFTQGEGIHQKIAAGYALALSVAAVGMTTGLVIGNHHQQQAENQRDQAHNQEERLTALKFAILATRSHQQQMIPTLQQFRQFKNEYAHYLAHLNEANQLFAELKGVARADSGLAANRDDLKGFLQIYEGTIAAYTQAFDRLYQQIQPATLTPEAVPAAQQQLLTFASRNVALKFDALSDDLTGLLETARNEERSAELKLSQADQLRTQIIVVSMLLSMLVATLLTFYISRAIARPLQKITSIAQQVTQHNDFDLQVPVTTTDEVGTLAIALNQLIQNVKLLLEEQQAESARQILQSEKMSSLGQMIMGIAHEINNPVNFVSGNLDHLKGYTQDLITLLDTYAAAFPQPPEAIQTKTNEIDLIFLQQDLPKLLDSVKFGVDRLRQIVLSLKHFSCLDEAELRVVDLHICLDSTLMILNHRIKKGIIVERNYENLPAIQGYGGSLYQVFMNLLSNALDAMDDMMQQSKNGRHPSGYVPRIVITTECCDQDWIVVKIADNGIGIAPDHFAKIFDPFFTTKPSGVGTGLGLSISHQIVVEKHGGKLTCQSQLGRGTTFVISLPMRQPDINDGALGCDLPWENRQLAQA